MRERVILLAEDNSDDIALIRRVFTRHNLKNGLAVVRDGQEVLDYLWARGLYEDRDTSIQPLLLLLESRLPKLDGLEVLQRLRAQPETSDLPVILLSSDDQDKKVVRGYGLAVEAFLRKPFRFAGFVKAARKAGLRWLLLDGSGPPGEEV
jgi:two-component system response regulator